MALLGQRKAGIRSRMTMNDRASYHAESAARAETSSAPRLRLTVGMGTCGQAAGAREVYRELEAGLTQIDGVVDLVPVGCQGACFAEPIVELIIPDPVAPALSGGSLPTGSVSVIPVSQSEYVHDQWGSDCRRITFGFMTKDLARTLIEYIDCLSANGVNEMDLLSGDSQFASLASCVLDGSFEERQDRRVMAHCGVIDPCSIVEYQACGGYEALREVLAERAPSSIIDEIEASGLRGRGGAGFPTGQKWRAMTTSDESTRYFIVNGDEGDPGAYMDRGLLESDPHRVLEGLIIACYATGVSQAYFFIRAEYGLAVKTVQRAIDDARAAGYLGDRILGTEFSLEVNLVRGAGAFLCGESTAMINVLEGGECTTRPKPPHLTERGLWGKPTCINNVETLANVPLIIEQGADWFRSVGTAESPGTKMFSVTGAVKRGGLVEVPLGSTLDIIVHDIGRAQDAKAVQIGGPSGAILPASCKDLEISYEGLNAVDGMMGSGGFVVISQDQCVVEVAKYLVEFSQQESCRKCGACRKALDEGQEIYGRLVQGQGSREDLNCLEELADRVSHSKLCGLGRTALNPVRSSIRFFRDEYEAHLRKECPALTCTALISYVISLDKCQGERCCLLTCPGNAIRGPFGKPGKIVGRLCQKCGMCLISCPYGAVRKVTPAVR